MARKKMYVWYLEPRGDKRTNDALALYFGADEDACHQIPCADGKPHNLWRCTGWNQCKEVLANKRSLNLDFGIFNQCGGGPIREVTNVFGRLGA